MEVVYSLLAADALVIHGGDSKDIAWWRHDMVTLSALLISLVY